MRCDEGVEAGVKFLAPRKGLAVHESRFGRRRDDRAVGRDAAVYDVLDERQEKLRLAFRDDFRVGVAQGDDALVPVLGELEVAHAVGDGSVRAERREVLVLHDYEVERLAELGHVLGACGEAGAAPVRRRVAGDYGVGLHALDVRAEAHQEVGHPSAPPEGPRLKHGVLYVRMVQARHFEPRQQHVREVVESEALFGVFDSREVCAEILEAPLAVARVVEDVVEHDAVEAAVR